MSKQPGYQLSQVPRRSEPVSRGCSAGQFRPISGARSDLALLRAAERQAAHRRALSVSSAKNVRLFDSSSEREKAGDPLDGRVQHTRAREGEHQADERNAVVTSKHLFSSTSLSVSGGVWGKTSSSKTLSFSGITAARTARSASSAAAAAAGSAALGVTTPTLTCAFAATRLGEPNSSSSNATTTTSIITSNSSSMSVGEERKNKTTRPEGPSRAVEVEHVEAPVSQAIVAMPKRHVRTGRVNCRWLYNQVQAARGLILIDARSREAFEEDTIPSSISIPPMIDCFTLDDVEKGMLAEQRYLFTVKRRKLRDVVLFGETVKSKNSRDPRNANADDSENSWLRHLERLIVEDGLVTSVKSLFDGFMTFKYRYPFYTTSAMLDEIAFGLTRTRSGTHNLNYPNEILEGFLFLGNMWHAQSKQVIQNLGITHIVNASLDVENVFATEGVQYKAVKIKDRPEADISVFFDSVYEFIESAKRTYHGRVLVHCTQGISRSATLVIMYLMRANNWSLVTAVNFAMASRGVVYPNEGFFRSLMAEEFRLYKGNSITLEEVDLLLQHQIPDRPVPLQIRHHKSENCSQCSKIFSLLEWKHKCSYCKKEFCSKCTSTRLANPEREKLVTGLEEQRKPRRVCDVCVSRLWKINLPRPRMGLQMRNPKCKHLNVNSLSTFGKPVCISYFEGTEPQVILDVIKTRFEVKTSQIVDISTEIGEPVENVAELPDESVVLVSIGKAGNVKDFSQRGKTRNRNQSHQQNLVMSPRERVLRGRFSSEGNVDALNEHGTKQKAIDIRRTNSFQLEQLAEAEQNDKKFREMWKLSFPTMGVIERQALLKIRNPAILTDVMLGVSSLSCGAMTIQDFNRRLVELGYADSDRELVVALLDKSRRANGLSMC